MNVLLLYPEFPDTFWSFEHALKFVRKRASLPPLGLLTVAAMLPPEWEKRLVDANVSTLHDADLAWADLVFIGAMIAQRDSSLEWIARCRAAGFAAVFLGIETPDDAGLAACDKRQNRGRDLVADVQRLQRAG